jgi:hypothetical protein
MLYAFDLIEHDGEDLRARPRKRTWWARPSTPSITV